MIKKLKIKFVILAVSSLFILLSLIVTGVNVINYSLLVKEADEILLFLSQNKGAFPTFKENMGQMGFPSRMSPEAPYASRYFSVLLETNGKVIITDMKQIASVDEAQAQEYAMSVLSSRNQQGFVEDFRYHQNYEDGKIRIVFLDCSMRLGLFRTFLYVSIVIVLVVLTGISILIVFLSGKIIKPVAESYEKQKRFITDAGHEIKTPLTIINANVELLEMELENHECLKDIRQQAERLTGLTNDLVYLARMEEADKTLEKVEIPISDIVEETVMGFKSLIQKEEKEFICSIQPLLSIKGDHKAIAQLISILMDNALKYSLKGGVIAVYFAKVNKCIQLNIYNTTDISVDSTTLNHVFERFYRSDSSRNSELGGHGIGLSVAKAIVDAHGGKIKAWTKDGHSFNLTVIIPL